MRESRREKGQEQSEAEERLGIIQQNGEFLSDVYILADPESTSEKVTEFDEMPAFTAITKN